MLSTVWGEAAVLEQIVRRAFSELDRAEVQERVAQLVERDPDLYLSRYVADPRSMGGRYVNSDLMKEMFDQYRRSPETRNRYNTAVHNAAAVLASEQYRRAVRGQTGSAGEKAATACGSQKSRSFKLRSVTLPGSVSAVR